VFEKTQLPCAFRADESTTDLPDDAKQLMLFNF
jgi:hypothetical protein